MLLVVMTLLNKKIVIIMKNKFSVSNPLDVTQITKPGRLANIKMERKPYILEKWVQTNK